MALARAIVRTPRLFLMDEPLSNLDAKLRSVMRAQLKHLQRDLATTTIYVTHDQIEAMTLADRIVVMKERPDPAVRHAGRDLCPAGATPLSPGFIGSPPMNLITGSVSDGRFVHPAGSFPVSAQADGKVTLGARPEDIRSPHRPTAICAAPSSRPNCLATPFCSASPSAPTSSM